MVALAEKSFVFS